MCDDRNAVKVPNQGLAAIRHSTAHETTLSGHIHKTLIVMKFLTKNQCNFFNQLQRRLFFNDKGEMICIFIRSVTVISVDKIMFILVGNFLN